MAVLPTATLLILYTFIRGSFILRLGTLAALASVPFFCIWFLYVIKTKEVEDEKKRFKEILSKIRDSLIGNLITTLLFEAYFYKVYMDEWPLCSFWVVLAYIIGSMVFWELYIPFYIKRSHTKTVLK